MPGVHNGVHVTFARCRRSKVIAPYTGLLQVLAWLPRTKSGHKHVTPGVSDKQNMPMKTIGEIIKSNTNNINPCNEILGIGGSPRRNGNSDILLNQIITAANEENIQCHSVQLRDMQYQGCIGCEKM